MEREELKNDGFELRCDARGCVFVRVCWTTEEFCEALRELNEHQHEDHEGNMYPTRLDLSPYDLRFLRGLKILVPMGT